MDKTNEPKIICYQVAWYKNETNKCFDEYWYEPDEINTIIECIREMDNDKYTIYCRLFAHFDDESEYEIEIKRR